MWRIFGSRVALATLTCAIAMVWGTVAVNPAWGDEAKLKNEFLKLCDEHAIALEDQAGGRAKLTIECFNAYVVRALAVAYDMEAKEEYLHACKRWSDQIIEHQNRMIPKGAYYMQYGRAPEEAQGKWYVADSSCIAMGVLATAVRCDDPAEKAKYMDSVNAFFRLVADNWIRPSGGIANGHWPKSDKEYWCATGTFGALAFCLYNETGDPNYLKIGSGAIGWLNRQNLLTVAGDHYDKKLVGPSVMMYSLEAYSVGMPHLETGGARHKAGLKQLANAHDWMLKNMGIPTDEIYLAQGGRKMGGLPFHLYIQAAWMPNGNELLARGDKELLHVAGILGKTPSTTRSIGTSQLASFALMSYAEKLAPGNIYRAGSVREMR